MLEPDGVGSLSFAQAQEKARAWIAEVGLGLNARLDRSTPITVREAVDEYLAWMREHRRSAYQTERSVNAYILPKLGRIRLDNLTTGEIRKWHEAIARARPRLRTAEGKPQNYRDASSDPDAVRRRRATANRVLTMLKAALNFAWREGKVQSDDAWRRVRPFPGVDSARVRYLTTDQCIRLVNAYPEDFRQLVCAALLTGCRYAELAALRVADFNPDAGTLLVRQSKSGKPRHVVLNGEGRDFFSQLTAGRHSNDRVLAKATGGHWSKAHQVRPMRDASQAARIDPPINFHALRHTYASLLIMGGAPLTVVAQNLGHADIRMVEKHYGHLAPSYVADTIRAAFPTLGVFETSKVVPVRSVG